jgi:hypothetical protein
MNSPASTHTIEIMASTVKDIRDVLGMESNAELEGVALEVADGATLTVSEVSKSSGFDATTVILTGVISLALNTSGAVLTEWLKAKLLKKPNASVGHPARGLTVVIDGKKVELAVE